MKRFLSILAFVVIAAIATVVVYRMALTQITAEVYRDRLQALSRDYSKLATNYNEAVRKTAVTELLVEEKKLTVVVRNAEGVVQQIDTPYDPTREIYVDYLVVDDRLWIRRVYDDSIAPSQGLVIDPSLAKVNWHNGNVAVGKAVYRSLTDGRWVVTVTGDGSLGLAKAEHDTPTLLSPPPPVRDYPQIEAELQSKLTEIGPGDVLRKLVHID